MHATVRARRALGCVALVAAMFVPHRTVAATTLVECNARARAGAAGSCTAQWTLENGVQFGVHLAPHHPGGAAFAAASLTWSDRLGDVIYRLTCESIYWPNDLTVESEVLAPQLECAETARGSFRPGLQMLTVTLSEPTCGYETCTFHGSLYVCAPKASTRLECRS